MAYKQPDPLKNLDSKDRNVTIYLHTSLTNDIETVSIDDIETIDTYLYRSSLLGVWG